MVRPKEMLEAGSLCALGDGQLLDVAQPLLGLDHQGESHERPPVMGWLAIVAVDSMIASW
jgi:hypothetical protein